MYVTYAVTADMYVTYVVTAKASVLEALYRPMVYYYTGLWRTIQTCGTMVSVVLVVLEVYTVAVSAVVVSVVLEVYTDLSVRYN